MATAPTIIQIERRPAGRDHELVSQLTDLYVQAKEQKARMHDEWTRNYRITKNRSAPAVPSAPGTRANEIFPTIDSRIGWMTDQEFIWSITPACDPFSLWSITTQYLGEQLEDVLNSLMKTYGWYAEIVKMLWDSAMYGCGFMKCGWDAGLLTGMGDVTMKAVSPWCIYLDPFASSLDDAQYICEVHSMTASEMIRRYPTVAEETIRQAAMTGDTDASHIPPNQDPNRQRQGTLIPVDAGQGATTWGQPGGAKTHASPIPDRAVNVYEMWMRENFVETIRPGDPTLPEEMDVIVDQWRVIVYSGDRILVDELAENLFHTDRHPYVRYVDVETGELWGDPILRDLAPCQQALNTLLAMGQNNIIYTGNPIMIGVKGSGVDRSTFVNRPGQIYDVNGSAGQAQANQPKWLAPPDLPPSLLQFAGFWREEIERIAGLSATQRGEVPSGRATDKQVQAGQEAGFIRIRSALRNLEQTLRKAGELLANLVIINYDTPRFVAIVGDEGEMSSLKLNAQHFYSPTVDEKDNVRFEPMRFAMTVNAGSSKPTSRAACIQEANILKQMNVVDDQYVLQAYQVSHWRAVQQRRQQQEQMQLQIAQAQRENAKGAGGAPKRQPSQKGPT